VTKISLNVGEADGVMVMFAVSCVLELTVTEFTAIPPPEKPTEVVPKPKLPPWIVRLRVLPMVALDGEILVIVGAGNSEAAVHVENELMPLTVTVFAPMSTVPPLSIHDPPSNLKRWRADSFAPLSSPEEYMNSRVAFRPEFDVGAI
jgi:hypothetical protein